jgi:hypothetical protein
MLAAAVVAHDSASAQQVQETNVMAKQNAAAAAEQKQPSASEPTYPRTAEISHKEAGELAKIPTKEVFAVNEYADKYHVITVAGQRIEVKK